MEILWKRTVSAEFWAIRPQLCRNCAFPQNFHTMKLDEILLFYAVHKVFKVVLLDLILGTVYVPFIYATYVTTSPAYQYTLRKRCPYSE